MIIHEYLNSEWRTILESNHAGNFDQLWEFDLDNWFEPPNQRRGGWSGVTRSALSLPAGGHIGTFIKRQENHGYRSWKNLFRLSSTFEREFLNLRQFGAKGIATLEPVYFGQRKVDGKLRAILITKELADYQAFDAADYQSIGKIDQARRKRIFASVGAVLRHLHVNHIQHNCLYPKHIFIREYPDGRIDVRLIDMEKAKWRSSRMRIATHDLCALNRHTKGWSHTDRLRLFLAYRQETRLSTESKRLLRAILRRMRAKDRI